MKFERSNQFSDKVAIFGRSKQTLKATPISAREQATKDDLETIYSDLSSCLTGIQEMLRHLSDPADKVCVAVLEDDVNDLLLECGDYLIAAEIPEPKSLSSLESRSLTVIDELKSFFSSQTRYDML